MKLYAISDLHLANRSNFDALTALAPHPDDWIILAGDTGELEDHLRMALIVLKSRFKKIIWVPGNHDLWSLPNQPYSRYLKGETLYRRLIAVCHEYGALTPEDPYPVWDDGGKMYRIVPMFLLYDYSFRPADISQDRAVEWAAESGVLCTDEELLHPSPYASRIAWCQERIRFTEERLKAAPPDIPLILVNHFPLRREMADLRRFPRFSVWCGTTRTEDWHLRFPVSVVVYGHMHMRGTRYVDGVRFEEVSLGYPRDWNYQRGMDYYLREILPGPSALPAFA
ncbi:MAG: metallophosphoesterase family protein [Candidatus Omnitrophota bacterium]